MSKLSRKDCIALPVLTSLHLSRLRGRSYRIERCDMGGGNSLHTKSATRGDTPTPPARASFARLAPPQAGEGAHLLRGDHSTYSNHAHTPRYACLMVSV